MQFEALKVFCDVARLRSFSQAALAQDPVITQSAVSQVVSQLERRLGVQLIDRSTRPLQLTNFGQAYYEGCSQLLEQYTELEANIRTAHAQLAGTVRVAAIYSVGLTDMGHYVELFKAEHPDVHVQLEYLHPDRVYERVRDGSDDFGLVSFPRKVPKLSSRPWRDEPLVLVCSPLHSLAPLATISPAHLEGEKYVHFDRGLVIRREIDRYLRERGVAVNVTMEFDSIENIKKAVEVGAGVSILPAPTVRREVSTDTLMAKPLVGCDLVRPLGIIYRTHHRLSSSAQRFLELLCESVPKNEQPAARGTAARARTRAHRNGTAPSPR